MVGELRFVLKQIIRRIGMNILRDVSTVRMAGGGVKGGHVHGATDEHGAAAVEKKMHINDLHATMLYLLGLDHEKRTYKYSGRDYRLTDLAGVVAKDVIA